jgi:hypothetical protein
VLYRTLLLALVFAVALSACGGGQAETCDEIADETIDLMQVLIKDVENEVGDISVEELIATEGELPSVEEFEEDAAKIDEQALELGCTQTEIQTAVTAKAGSLEATTPIGQFIVEAIRSGGL